MIVRDAYGYDVELEDDFDQDFEIEITPQRRGMRPFLHPWNNRSNPASRGAAFALSAAKRHQKDLIRAGLERLAVDPSTPATIVLTRVAYRGTLDDDNVPDAFKYVRDEIARWMGLKGDTRRHGVRFLYGQQKSSRKGYLAARITITEGPF